MRRLLVALLLACVVGPAWGQQFNTPLTPPALPQPPQLPPAQATLPAPPGSKAPSSFPARMSIIDSRGVEVRSGPTEKFRPTSRLKYGDVVTVVRESEQQPGWFAIVPPMGSFSWIDAKNVLQVDRKQGVVVVDKTVVLPGSSLVNTEPNAQSATLAAGHVVVFLQDQPMETNGSKWWLIQPTGTEVRFIPKDAVQPTEAVTVRPPNWSQPNATGNGWTAPGQNVGNASKPTVGTPASFSQPATPWTQYDGLTKQPPQWSQWGKLRRTAFEKDGQLMYVLEDRQGRPLIYVTTTAGTSLRNYENQMVCLYGAVAYRSDGYQRTYYMTASHVATP